jgi:hypothetical protein
MQFVAMSFFRRMQFADSIRGMRFVIALMIHANRNSPHPNLNFQQKTWELCPAIINIPLKPLFFSFFVTNFLNLTLQFIKLLKILTGVENPYSVLKSLIFST